ncbi:YkgJ family cysteine cluster protein [Deltaproteobacteria bacterium TL4]
MTKKTKNKRSLFRFEMMEGSLAIQKNELHAETETATKRTSTPKFLNQFKAQALALSEEAYPHQNRLVALVHSLCDQVSQKTLEKMQRNAKKVACSSGCSACCYYTEMDATGIEFEVIIHYIRHQMLSETRQSLLQQIENEPDFSQSGFRPCPFLIRSSGNCGVYRVRPMGCRGLLATKKCQLTVEEDTGLKACVKLAAESWQEMEVRGGTLLIAMEHSRQQKAHFNMHCQTPAVLIQFKQLESERLIALFS